MTILNKKKRDNIEDILNTFELSAIQQSSAQEQGDHKTYNKFQKIIMKCIVKLHDGHCLHLLQKFLTHDNSNVRLCAAYALLPVCEKESMSVLDEIAKGKYFLQSISAEWTMRFWRNGELIYPYQKEYGNKETVGTKSVLELESKS